MTREHDPNDHKPPTFDGYAYGRALEYPLVIAPKTPIQKQKKASDKDRFRHVVFHLGRIVASNCGKNLRIGHLPPGSARDRIGKPIAVTQASAEELRVHLGNSARLARLKNAAFSVSQVGYKVWIDVDQYPTVEFELQPASVGELPARWMPPQTPDIRGVPKVKKALLEHMLSKTASWGQGEVDITLAGVVAGPRRMIMGSLMGGEQVIGTCYEIVDDGPAAQLPPLQANLLEPAARGWSVLDLRWDDVPINQAPPSGEDGEDEDDTVTLSDAMAIQDAPQCLIADGGCGAEAGKYCKDEDGNAMGNVVHACRMMAGMDDPAPPVIEQPKKGGGRGRGGKKAQAH